jgi:pimeloyl-ACP methyl ester carboxylesterase
MPVTILAGMGDRLMPVDNSKNLANAIPDVRLVLVSGCEHGVQVQCQDLLIQEIEDGCR